MTTYIIFAVIRLLNEKREQAKEDLKGLEETVVSKITWLAVCPRVCLWAPPSAVSPWIFNLLFLYEVVFFRSLIMQFSLLQGQRAPDSSQPAYAVHPGHQYSHRTSEYPKQILFPSFMISLFSSILWPTAASYCF